MAKPRKVFYVEVKYKISADQDNLIIPRRTGHRVLAKDKMDVERIVRKYGIGYPMGQKEENLVYLFISDRYRFNPLRTATHKIWAEWKGELVFIDRPFFKFLYTKEFSND